MPKPNPIRLKWFWPSALALVLACMVGGLSPRWSANSRVTNLELANDSIQDTYLMFSKSSPGKCHVLRRREATMRRSDAGQKGKPYTYRRFGGGSDGDLDSWLTLSKAKGTLFFVPVERVSDWTYPFLYQFVRSQFKDIDLPLVEWTQLFVNRMYSGLYLRITLPYDKRKKDGRTEPLRELLTVDGDTLMKVDTRFNDAGLLYVSTVVDGKLSTLGPPHPAVAWLSARCPTAETTLLMDNKPPHDVSLLPLPVTMSSLYESLYGRLPELFVDERYRRWTSWTTTLPAAPPFTDEQQARLREDFARYAKDLRIALRNHGLFHQKLDALRGLLPGRQTSVADLGLKLGEL